MVIILKQLYWSSLFIGNLGKSSLRCPHVTLSPWQHIQTSFSEKLCARVWVIITCSYFAWEDLLDKQMMSQNYFWNTRGMKPLGSIWENWLVCRCLSWQFLRRAGNRLQSNGLPGQRVPPHGLCLGPELSHSKSNLGDSSQFNRYCLMHYCTRECKRNKLISSASKLASRFVCSSCHQQQTRKGYWKPACVFKYRAWLRPPVLTDSDTFQPCWLPVYCEMDRQTSPAICSRHNDVCQRRHKQLWSEPLKLWAKIHLYFLSLLPEGVFVTMTERWHTW